MDIKKGLATGIMSLAALVGVQSEAQTLYAYVHETIPANSDVLISVPINNVSEVELATTGVSGSVISFANSTAFGAGDYDDGPVFPIFYVRVIDGPAAGLWASITANSETSITVDNADVAAAMTAGGGDTIRVYRHQTLGSIIPASLNGISAISTPGIQTQALFYSTSDTQNKAPGSGGTATFVSPIAGWGGNNARPVNPEEAFIIRNRSTTQSLTFIKPGIAPDHPVSYLIKGGVVRDTAFGHGYPASILLPDTNLGAVLQNRILFQTVAGQNNAPGNDGTFTFINPVVGWGGGNTKLIRGNQAFIFRQPATDGGGIRTVTKPY